MRRPLLFVAVVAGLLNPCVGPVLAAAEQKSNPPVKIVVDVSQAPEAKAWAEKAKALCEKWYPIICDYLRTEGDSPPQIVKLVFEKNRRGVAGTSGATIKINAKWVTDHPDDIGMVIHELTHVVQRYPHFNRQTWWMVEGIADYIRYYRFEPGKRKLVVNPKRVSYKNGYHPAAAFLDWIQRTYDKKLVQKLNEAMRKGTYKEAIFKKRTGKDLDELWREFFRDEIDPATRKKDRR